MTIDADVLTSNGEYGCDKMNKCMVRSNEFVYLLFVNVYVECQNVNPFV